MSRLLIYFSVASIRGHFALEYTVLPSYHFLWVDGYFFCKVQSWEAISSQSSPSPTSSSLHVNTHLLSSSSPSTLSLSVSRLVLIRPISDIHFSPPSLSRHLLLSLPLISLHLCGGAITPASLNAGDLSILALCIVCSNLPAASPDECLHSQLHPLH